MHNIILLDKPHQLSSNAALQKIKKIFHAKKAGHGGTLDPAATGMLPIFLNEATKFSQFMLDADKTYLVSMRLGVRTDTADATGEIIATKSAEKYSIDFLKSFLFSWVGSQQQIPPMHSALKYQGKKLYEYARAGVEIERVPRNIVIHDIIFLSYENNDVTFRVACSKGTYIRTLVDDMGEKLGCGAHVILLRRLSIAGFRESQMRTFSDCDLLSREEMVLPIDSVLQHLLKIEITEYDTMQLRHGQWIARADVLQNQLVRLYADSNFVGVGEINNHLLKPVRLLQEP